METIPSEMLRGHVDTIILLSLLDCDKHTSQIKEEIESRVDGQFELKQGTFYSCLQRITGQGFVMEYRSSSADGKRRKFYQLTEKGKAYIEDNKDKWLFSRNVIDTLIQVPQDSTKIDSVYSYEPAEKISEVSTSSAQNAPLNVVSNETAPINAEQIEHTVEKEIPMASENDIATLHLKLAEIQNELQSIKTSKIETENLKPQDLQVQDENAIENNENVTNLEKYLSGEFDASVLDNGFVSDDAPIQAKADEPQQPINLTVNIANVIPNAVQEKPVEILSENSVQKDENSLDLIDLINQKTAEEQAQNSLEINNFEQEESDETAFSSVQTQPSNQNSSNQFDNETIKALINEVQELKSAYKNNSEVSPAKVNVKTNESFFANENKVLNGNFDNSSKRIDEVLKQNYAETSQKQQNVQNKFEKEYQVEDYFSGEESISHDYKSVLSKLFPQKPSFEQNKAEEGTASKPLNSPNAGENDINNYFEQVPTENKKESEKPKIIVSEMKRPSPKVIKQINKSKVRPEKFGDDDDEVSARKTNNNKYDFSEIYKLAEEEGFKVKTSSTRTNREIGKIFINKLIASSTLTFYIIAFIEILVLALTTRNVSGFSFLSYMIVAIVLAIFPITTSIMYFVEPKRKIDSVLSFKSIMSFVFVVVLNLIVIICVYALLVNVDFTNSQMLLTHVFYPLIVVLNIPIYFFIEYLKLDNQKYYS